MVKTLVEHVGHNERSIVSALCRAVLGREKPNRSRGAQSGSDEKGNRIGEARANEDVEEDVLDLISQVHMKLTIRLRDKGAATYWTSFLLRSNANMAEIQTASRAYNDTVTKQPSAERGPAHLVLDCDAEERGESSGDKTHRNDPKDQEV